MDFVLYFKRFFISLLFTERERDTQKKLWKGFFTIFIFSFGIFAGFFCLSLFMESSNASVLIVPQVFMMYYGGFYCVFVLLAVCMSSTLMELKGGVSWTYSMKFMIFISLGFWKMVFCSIRIKKSGKKESNMSGGC